MTILSSKLDRCVRPAASALFIAASLCGLWGCETKPVDRDVLFASNSAEAIEIMSKPRGTFGISGSPRAAWVDPRGDAEFASEHIPGAIHLPFPRLEAEHMVALKDKDVLVVYDNDNDTSLALPYAKRLLLLGYKEVYCLQGGLKGWKRDGNPTAKK